MGAKRVLGSNFLNGFGEIGFQFSTNSSNKLSVLSGTQLVLSAFMGEYKSARCLNREQVGCLAELSRQSDLKYPMLM